MTRTLIGIIIVGMVAVVNASERKTLQDVIKEARASGETVTPTSDDIAIAKVPANTPGRGLEVDAKDASDGATHDFVVYPDSGMPTHVILAVVRDGHRSEEFLNLACDATGKLNKCYSQRGEKDDKGKPIPGSAVSNEKSPGSRAMKSALRRELDFWLKGMYRKPGAKSTS